jgi:putative FmdB family regulatory protein
LRALHKKVINSLLNIMPGHVKLASRTACDGERAMPTYEYRCNACRRKVTLFYKTYADYDAATHTCTRCGSTDLTRLISRVAIKRSPISRLMSGSMDDDSMLDDLDTEDPKMMGRMLREMSSEVGEDMGDEFEEVVQRLEHGESPEDIEAALPPDLGDSSSSGLPGGLDDLG